MATDRIRSCRAFDNFAEAMQCKNRLIAGMLNGIRKKRTVFFAQAGNMIIVTTDHKIKHPIMCRFFPKSGCNGVCQI